jgi:hypothetical protein
MTMRTPLVLAAIVGLSAAAFAQTGAPKVGGKPLKQVKPRAAMGCKLVGTGQKDKALGRRLRGRARARGATPSAEPEAPAPTPEANPPADKQ